MSDELHKEVMQALEARSVWELRQAVWDQMRGDGIRRVSPPWKNAADMHYPLADANIDKLKPFYLKQIFGSEVVASFYSIKKDFTKFNSAAEQWFDHKIRHQSNFKKQMHFCIDTMLNAGKTFVKVFWDIDEKKLRFENIKPLYIIVPSWTRELEECDWLVHVQQFSIAAYKGRKDFKQGDDFIARIKKADDSVAAQSKFIREGITKPHSDNQIVVWERYQKVNGEWKVRTYSPCCPDEDIATERVIPYQHKKLMFVPLECEWKDDGHYSSRGICERLAPFEAALCKTWNEKLDAMTIFNRPLLYSNGKLNNTTNLRWRPGQVINGQLTRVDYGSPPISYDQEMQNTRMIAEQLIQSPDFGLTQAGSGRDSRSATEIERISQLSGQTQDGRGFVFADQLQAIFSQAFALLKQYDAESLEYFFRSELVQLDKSALQGSYHIEPSCAGDAWNKAFRFQKSAFRLDKLKGHPNIQQDELVKDFLESDDSRLIKRLYRNNMAASAEQMEDQAQEISIMLMGFPAAVQATDDDAAHLTSLMQFVARRAERQEPITPEMARLFLVHSKQHGMQLKTKSPEQLQQIMQQYGNVLSFLAEIAASDAPQQQEQNAGGAA
jgi:hypothetical protein